MSKINFIKVELGREYNVEDPLYWPCHCCGMTVANSKSNSDPRNAGKGIRVLTGHLGKEVKTGLIRTQHVKTRNGDLTVVTQHGYKSK